MKKESTFVAEIKKKAALYVRVSTDAQREDGYSIEAQCEMLEAYCKSRQIRKYEFYIDGGFSGSSIERPEISRLISDVARGMIDQVIVYKLDRLSRSQKDTLYLIEDVFNPQSVAFVSLNENMDTSTPIGRAMLGIMSAFAQLERETIRERTRMGMKERVKNGLWMGGGHIPFGYDYDRDSGILVPNADAATVRKIYELYLSGWSLQKISQKVGLKYEHMARQILLRKTNTGIISYNGVDYKGQHEPIITDEIYKKAMQLYSERSKKGLTTAKGLLAGLLYCGFCGAKLRYQKWGKNGYKLNCYSKDKSKPHLIKDPNCRNTAVWADEVETIVIGDLFAMAKRKLDPTDSDQAENSDNMRTFEYLEKKIASLRKKLKKLYNLYAESDEDTLLDTITENKNELAEAEKQLENEKNALNDENMKIERYREINDLKSAWDYMTFVEQQNILRQFVDKIIITDGNVEIYYRI